MAKPIFIVGFPISANPEAIQRTYLDLTTKLGEDYHVLTYRTSKIEDVAFNVLNAEHASDVELSELFETTREQISQLLDEIAALELTQIENILPKNNP